MTDSEPEVAFCPLQLPEAEQVVAFVEVQESVVSLPVRTDNGSADKFTVGLGAGGGVGVGVGSEEPPPPPPQAVSAATQIKIMIFLEKKCILVNYIKSFFLFTFNIKDINKI